MYFFKFSGDIGGAMGLFIGGSVLTVLEFADAIFHNAMKLFFGFPKRWKKYEHEVKKRTGAPILSPAGRIKTILMGEIAQGH